MIMNRESVNGKAKLDEQNIIDFINKNTKSGIQCEKNPDNFGIDLHLKNSDDTIVSYIEVEGSNRGSWYNAEKPTWKSRMMTMPIRKLRFFAQDHGYLNNYLKNYSTIEINEFLNLFNLDQNPEYNFKPLTDKPRFWLKLSNDVKYFCIVDAITITNAINDIKPDNGYMRNIWQNRGVTSKDGKIRADKTFLIVGNIDSDANLNWGKFYDDYGSTSYDLIEFLDQHLIDNIMKL